MCLHGAEIGIFDHDFSKIILAENINSGSMQDDNWLLLYESAIHGWLSGKSGDVLAKDEYFSALKTAGVSFYNKKSTNKSINIPGVAMRLSMAGRKNNNKILPGNILPPKKGELWAHDYVEEVGGDCGEMEDKEDEWLDDDNDEDGDYLRGDFEDFGE